MEIGIVTLFPDMISAFGEYGVTGRAIRDGLVKVSMWNPRAYTHSPHGNVDDRPYGGGPGMVMQVQPLRDAINAARAALSSKPRVVYLSPQGERLTQAGARRLAGYDSLLLIAGRYEGVDERLIAAQVDEECSIGDYVLSGGELAALVVMDALIRLMPGVLGHEDSAAQDSFMDGLLDYPHYTRPEEVDGLRVPEVLLSGDHRAIARWRKKQALGRTWLRRPDLLAGMLLTQEQQILLNEFIEEYKQ
ncbi:MAG: tRNA (guanosine(37)-N1)-methyltransferase TrmD [Gammaproteobacteria bacterium]|nr:tRNA (guanosine(37)-N1)-methyltransferase TrmD [Gammaproteobacteria bacterium]